MTFGNDDIAEVVGNAVHEHEKQRRMRGGIEARKPPITCIGIVPWRTFEFKRDLILDKEDLVSGLYTTD